MSGFSSLFRQSGRPRCWHTLEKQNVPAAESFLREREKTCVIASASFPQLGKTSRAWFLSDKAGKIASLLIHSHGSLIPVLGENKDVPAPRFIKRILSRMSIHSSQGIAGDMEVFENFLGEIGWRISRAIDYDLMYMDMKPEAGVLPRLPGLVLRPPEAADIDAMFPLQAAYEKEEVLTPDAVFNSASCRLTLERIIHREHALVACLDGRIVGKINTNAESFTRYQIGGVYVHPDYRRMGIATLMTAGMVESLIARGKGASLFVKKQNIAAKAVYRRIGFANTGEYRISYY
jgi:ribosomal protein S18 acetylase RimI-like enzyme